LLLAGQLLKGRRITQLLVFLEERLILRKIGVKSGDQRQVGVVNLTQFGAVHHRIEVRHLPPGPSEAFVGIFQHADEVFPLGRGVIGGQAVEQRPGCW